MQKITLHTEKRRKRITNEFITARSRHSVKTNENSQQKKQKKKNLPHNQNRREFMDSRAKHLSRPKEKEQTMDFFIIFFFIFASN